MRHVDRQWSHRDQAFGDRIAVAARQITRLIRHAADPIVWVSARIEPLVDRVPIGSMAEISHLMALWFTTGHVDVERDADRETFREHPSGEIPGEPRRERVTSGRRI